MHSPRKLQRLVGAVFLIAIGLLVVGPFILAPSGNKTVTTAESSNNNHREEPVSVLSMTPEERRQHDLLSLETQDDLHNRPYQQGGMIQEGPTSEELWARVEGERRGSTQNDSSANTRSTQNNVTNENNSLALNTQPLNSPHNINQTPVIPEQNQSTSFERSQRDRTTQNSNPPTTQNTRPQQETPKPQLPSLSLASSSDQAVKATTQSNTQTATNRAQQSNQYQWFVQVGVFQNTGNAQKQYKEFQDAGYPVYIELEDNLHKVRLGPYKTRDNATRVQNNLKGAGIPTSLIAPRS